MASAVLRVLPVNVGKGLACFAGCKSNISSFLEDKNMLTKLNKRIKERDSNIELLRIVCILFVLIHHFIVHSLYPDSVTLDGDINTYRVVCIFINGFVYVGVNCFILISGYYGIKFRFRSLMNLYCICVFFTVIATLMKMCVTDVTLNKGLLYSIFLPFSHSEWWFITCYVALYLISPALNKSVQYLGRNEFILTIALLTVLNVYLGYFWHQHNVDGFNLLQFIYVYYIGAFLKKFPLEQLNRKNSLLLYITGALLWSLLSVISVRWKIPHWISFCYNNPLVILSSVGLFYFMTQIKIHSYTINFIAASVLAAYLIQDIPGGMIYALGDLYNGSYIIPLDNMLLKVLSMLIFVVFASLLTLCSAIILDRLRLLLMKPVWKIYDHYFPSR